MTIWKIINGIIPLEWTCLLLILGLTGITNPLSGQDKQQEIMKLKDMAPAKGYVRAHKDLQQPQELLGGPVSVNIEQNSGGVFVILPSVRELDPDVFGNPKMPRAFAGTPGINGVPPMARKVNSGEYTEMKTPTPFGNKNVVMGNGKLQIKATDATATDAATTNDEVQMSASWQDEEGNTYEVRCCEMLAAHGMEFPTFGGVVTNHILHGFTRIGTALMPSEYTYFAFWGMGTVLKNGEVTDKPRLVHGMLTEYVRKEGYELAFDHEVTPGRKHFHLMVAPMKPVPEKLTFEHSNVNTGFELPDGKTLPFWHVMFENLEIESSR